MAISKKENPVQLSKPNAYPTLKVSASVYRQPIISDDKDWTTYVVEMLNP